jgi:hypothetical protein
MKVLSPRGKKYVDVFPIINKNDHEIMMYMQSLRLKSVPRDVVLPLTTIEFYGNMVSCPAKPEQLMQLRYGDTWSIPDRFAGMTWLSRSEVVST